MISVNGVAINDASPAFHEMAKVATDGEAIFELRREVREETPPPEAPAEQEADPVGAESPPPAADAVRPRRASVHLERTVCYFEPDGTRVGFNEAGDVPALDVDVTSYKYGEREVLHDVKFAIPQGARVGIIGKSGAGKSTLLKIITRLYPVPPHYGQIKVKGTPINDAVLSELVTTMEQTPVIFSGTVRENLLLGLEVLAQRPDPSSSPWGSPHFRGLAFSPAASPHTPRPCLTRWAHVLVSRVSAGQRG